MKRSLVLLMLALAVWGGAAQAAPVAVSAGAFAGLSIPVLQDVPVSSFSPSDAFGDTGSQLGLRASVKAIPVITFEPYFAKSSYKDRTDTISGISYTREGFDGSAFGLNFLLGRPDGPGFHFFPYVGVSTTKLSRTNEEIKKSGYNFGLGFGIAPAPKFSIQVRGDFAMVVTGDTSRKFANANVGLSYSLLP